MTVPTIAVPNDPMHPYACLMGKETFMTRKQLLDHKCRVANMWMAS